jgi:hypothetical protein
MLPPRTMTAADLAAAPEDLAAAQARLAEGDGLTASKLAGEEKVLQEAHGKWIRILSRGSNSNLVIIDDQPAS